MDFLGDNLSKLSDLLKEADEHEHRPTKEMQRPSGAGTMTVKTGASAAVKMPGQGEEDKGKDNAAIWDEKEVPDEEALIDEGDDRPTPRYEFAYKQSVSTEDTFLGLGDNSPATSDCTHLVVKVHFPGSTMKDISLDVTKNRIKATSKTHRLFTYLPVTVQKDKGAAKFDSKKNVLSITLPIIHDLGGL
jgi:hypothetical protein